MSRCQRCHACESMWENPVCRYCGFPGTDTRTPGQKDIDDAEIEEFYKEGDDEH